MPALSQALIPRKNKAMGLSCTLQLLNITHCKVIRKLSAYLGHCGVRLKDNLLDTILHSLQSEMVLKRIQDHKEHFWVSAYYCLESELLLVF